MTIKAWSADGKSQVTIEGDPNHQTYISIQSDEELPAVPSAGDRGEGRSQVALSPYLMTFSSLERWGRLRRRPLFFGGCHE